MKVMQVDSQPIYRSDGRSLPGFLDELARIGLVVLGIALVHLQTGFCINYRIIFGIIGGGGTLVNNKLFIAPASTEYLNRNTFSEDVISKKKHIFSLEGLIPEKIVIDALAAEEKEKVRKLLIDQKVRIWGTRRANKRFWEIMDIDDYVIFYKDGTYVYLGTVTYKTQNQSLAEKIWGRHRSGELWEYVFFLKNVRDISEAKLTREKFNETAGYEKDFVPQAFMRVADDDAKEKILTAISCRDARPKEPIGEILRRLTVSIPSLHYSNTIKAVLAHLVAGKNVLFYGPPATSKTYVATKICEAICVGGSHSDEGYSLHTANAEWSHFDIFGGEIVSGDERYFRPGIIFEGSRKCKERVESSGIPYWLVIDELNRANLDLAFGKVFTQLDIEYRHRFDIHEGEMESRQNKLRIPLSFRILATMNVYDRSLLFSLGYAFMRRFAFVPFSSLLRKKATSSDPQAVSIPDIMKEEMSEIRKSEEIQGIKKKTTEVAYQHFSTKIGNDKAFLFDGIETKSPDEIEEVISSMKLGEYDIVDALTYLAYKITNEGLVEIGHAILFDATKFLFAYHKLFPDDSDFRKLLDEAVIAYILPQLEYFMPKLRKGKLFEEGNYDQRWQTIIRTVEALGLPRALRILKEAEEDFRVIA